MKGRRFSVQRGLFSILSLLLAAVLCCGCCFAEESTSVTLVFSESAPLEAGIRAAVSSGCRELCVIDDVSEAFQPDALYGRICAILSALTPEFGCRPSDAYSFNEEQRSIQISIDYLSASELPEPFALTPTGKSVSYQITASDGTILPSDMLGSRALLLFGRSSCADTIRLLDGLYPLASVLNGNVRTIVCTLSSDDLAFFDARYPLFTCASSDLRTARRLLQVFDATLSSFATPLVFVQDADGTLIFHSSGPVAEPARIAATALVRKNASVTLPASLAFIGEEAFEGCGGLTTVLVPDSVAGIGADAFLNCPDLTLLCSSSSFAAQYASENNLDWREP